MVHGCEGARCFEVLRFNWVMGNYQLKNMSLYTIICLTGLTSSQLQVPIHSRPKPAYSMFCSTARDDRIPRSTYTLPFNQQFHGLGNFIEVTFRHRAEFSDEPHDGKRLDLKRVCR